MRLRRRNGRRPPAADESGRRRARDVGSRGRAGRLGAGGSRGRSALRAPRERPPGHAASVVPFASARAERLLPFACVAAAAALFASELTATFQFIPPGGEALCTQQAADRHHFALGVLAIFAVGRGQSWRCSGASKPAAMAVAVAGFGRAACVPDRRPAVTPTTSARSPTRARRSPASRSSTPRPCPRRGFWLEMAQRPGSRAQRRRARHPDPGPARHPAPAPAPRPKGRRRPAAAGRDHDPASQPRLDAGGAQPRRLRRQCRRPGRPARPRPPGPAGLGESRPRRGSSPITEGAGRPTGRGVT